MPHILASSSSKTVYLMIFISLCMLSINPAQADTMQSNAQTQTIDRPQVLIKTNVGDITLELFNQKAPISVSNFLTYVNEGFYNDLIFHRVIAGFMIQGGGFDHKLNKKTTKAPIKNEAMNKISNERGTIAMARTNAIHSASSQFFINLKENTTLDNSTGNFGYAVFGQVIKGMDIVDQIASSNVKRVGMHQHMPSPVVYIKSAIQINTATPVAHEASKSAIQ